MEFIEQRQGVMSGNRWLENGCRYCGIQENEMAHQYFRSMVEHIHYDDMEICVNGYQMFYDDGCCPLCRFIDKHSCDSCSVYNTDIQLRYHQLGMGATCIECEDEYLLSNRENFQSRCRDAGCDLCADYESDSD